MGCGFGAAPAQACTPTMAKISAIIAVVVFGALAAKPRAIGGQSARRKHAIGMIYISKDNEKVPEQ